VSEVLVSLPEREDRDDMAVVFASTVCEVQALSTSRTAILYLPADGEDMRRDGDLRLDAAEARSLAAALLAAADASEATA